MATAVVHYTAAAVTDRGRKRPSNEDAFGFSVEHGVYVVCDGMGGAEAGHLYLRVVFAKHPEFRVRDANLYHDLELAPWAAVLGGSVRVPTLDGTVALRIPPDPRAGREFRLRGLGLPGTNGARGDLHVRVSIQIPPRITPAERVLWEKLAAASASQPENAS